MKATLIMAFAFAAIAVILGSVTTLAYAQTSGMIMQESFVNTVWGLIAAIMAGFMTLSSIAIYWAKKAKEKAEKSGNKKLAETMGKFISALETGQQFVKSTQNQEVKIKQLGEILFQFMGPKANEISGKYQVKLEELTKDVQSAVKGSTEYNEKLKELYDLYDQISSEIGGLPPVTPPVTPL